MLFAFHECALLLLGASWTFHSSVLRNKLKVPILVSLCLWLPIYLGLLFLDKSLSMSLYRIRLVCMSGL